MTDSEGKHEKGVRFLYRNKSYECMMLGSFDAAFKWNVRFGEKRAS